MKTRTILPDEQKCSSLSRIPLYFNFPKMKMDNEVIGEKRREKIYIVEGNENSVEGTYIFAKESIYYILFTEKGKIREKNKDFRHKLFEKEVEIYSSFGEEFEKHKKRKIEKILKENPYNDV